VLDLLPLCDSVTKLAAQCGMCAGRPRPALFSMRIAGDKSGAQELVGGAEVYKPVCRGCYVAHHEVVEDVSAEAEPSRAEAVVR